MKLLFWIAAAVLVGVLALAWMGSGPSRGPAGGRLPERPSAPPAGLEAIELEPCAPAPAFVSAADDNTRSLRDMVWTPFHREEAGWETYAALVGQEIRTRCGPAESGFAQALSRWQVRHGLAGDGRMSPATFEALKAAWHRRRPLRGQLDPANCPPAPPASDLATARSEDGFRGKVVQLRPAVLDAIRRMRAAARAEVPAIAADPDALTIISGYRDPQGDALRCLMEGNCDNVRRSSCSAHRTGLVADIHVGAATGYESTSTENVNRLHQSRTPAYRWMVANAHRFGFINYPFEPWHWEWGGDDHAPREMARRGEAADPGAGLRGAQQGRYGNSPGR